MIRRRKYDLGEEQLTDLQESEKIQQ